LRVLSRAGCSVIFRSVLCAGGGGICTKGRGSGGLKGKEKKKKREKKSELHVHLTP
jgi:hypothetical protein